MPYSDSHSERARASRRAASRLYRERHPTTKRVFEATTCAQCQTVFEPQRYEQKFCSDLCQHRQHYQDNRRAYRGYQLKAKFGLTNDDFEMRLIRQRGACAICLTWEPGGRWGQWHVDHDHDSGRVRGLLCHDCNTSLKKHLTPEVLRRMADYVAHAAVI